MSSRGTIPPVTCPSNRTISVITLLSARLLHCELADHGILYHARCCRRSIAR